MRKRVVLDQKDRSGVMLVCDEVSHNYGQSGLLVVKLSGRVQWCTHNGDAYGRSFAHAVFSEVTRALWTDEESE